jgi:cytochrome P450
MDSKVTKNVPKVPFIFLLRRLFNLKKNLLNELEYLHSIYGDVFGIQVENLKCFIKKPELIKQVLVHKHLNYEKGVGFKFFQNIIGLGLLTSDGKKWSDERKVLNREFSNQSQDKNFEIIQEELIQLQKKLKGEKKNQPNSVSE